MDIDHHRPEGTVYAHGAVACITAAATMVLCNGLLRLKARKDGGSGDSRVPRMTATVADTGDGCPHGEVPAPVCVAHIHEAAGKRPRHTRSAAGDARQREHKMEKLEQKHANAAPDRMPRCGPLRAQAMAKMKGTPLPAVAPTRVPRCGPLRAQAMAGNGDPRAFIDNLPEVAPVLPPNPRAFIGDLLRVAPVLPPELQRIPAIYKIAGRYLEAFTDIPGIKHIPGPEYLAYQLAFRQYSPGYSKKQMVDMLHKYLGLPDVDTIETELRVQARSYMHDDWETARSHQL